MTLTGGIGATTSINVTAKTMTWKNTSNLGPGCMATSTLTRLWCYISSISGTLTMQ